MKPTIFFITIVLFCFIWRLIPLLRRPHAGCDAYYFLLCREAFRHDKKIPIVLPHYYVLEYQEQWYPPGFTIFLSLIPDKILDRLYWCVSPALDSLICGSVFLFISLFTDNLTGAVLAALLYIFSMAAIPETQSLTSRQLGSLLLNFSVVAGILYVSRGNVWFLVVSVGSGVLLLLTHKLSTQAWYLSLALMGFIAWEFRFAVILISGVIAALLISTGFYWKILRCHWDYIRFWTKKWPFIGGHQIEDSPVYRSEKTDRNLVFKEGQRQNLRFIREFLSQNPYCVILFSLLSFSVVSRQLPQEYYYFALWSLIVLGLGIVSYCIPMFRGIGFGGQYGKLALPVGMICCAYAAQDQILRYLVYFILLIALWQGGRYMVSILLSDMSQDLYKWDFGKMGNVFAYLKELNNPLVMCLPTNYCDLIAFHARIRVLWGTHGSPTRNWEHIVPVLTEPVETTCENQNVTHLFIDTRFVIASRIGIQNKPSWSEGNFEIYEMHE